MKERKRGAAVGQQPVDLPGTSQVWKLGILQIPSSPWKVSVFAYPFRISHRGHSHAASQVPLLQRRPGNGPVSQQSSGHNIPRKREGEGEVETPNSELGKYPTFGLLLQPHEGGDHALPLF
jgi:hypothetical protein